MICWKSIHQDNYWRYITVRTNKIPPLTNIPLEEITNKLLNDASNWFKLPTRFNRTIASRPPKGIGHSQESGHFGTEDLPSSHTSTNNTVRFTVKPYESISCCTNVMFFCFECELLLLVPFVKHNADCFSGTECGIS